LTAPLEIYVNRASVAQLARHLRLCDQFFVPPLSERVTLMDYSAKLYEKAERFEAWIDTTLVGLLAGYYDAESGVVAFITSVSVLKEWQGRGVASVLVERSIAHAQHLGFELIELQVALQNDLAVRLYRKHGFQVISQDDNQAKMALALKR
jgi:ribosomal protein S18 acetylase RimI-like enzyme